MQIRDKVTGREYKAVVVKKDEEFDNRSKLQRNTLFIKQPDRWLPIKRDMYRFVMISANHEEKSDLAYGGYSIEDEVYSWENDISVELVKLLKRSPGSGVGSIITALREASAFFDGKCDPDMERYMDEIIKAIQLIELNL